MKVFLLVLASFAAVSVGGCIGKGKAPAPVAEPIFVEPIITKG